jgi:hypothetical protein
MPAMHGSTFDAPAADAGWPRFQGRNLRNRDTYHNIAKFRYISKSCTLPSRQQNQRRIWIGDRGRIGPAHYNRPRKETRSA